MPQHFQRTEAGLLHLVVVISLTDTELDTQRCLCWSQPAFTLSSTKAHEQTLESAGPPEGHTHSLLRFSKTEHWVCGKLWLPLFAARSGPQQTSQGTAPRDANSPEALQPHTGRSPLDTARSWGSWAPPPAQPWSSHPAPGTRKLLDPNAEIN